MTPIYGGIMIGVCAADLFRCVPISYGGIPKKGAHFYKLFLKPIPISKKQS